MARWISNITRERIIMDKHSRKRARKRCSSEEVLYEYLIERRFKKIDKKIKSDTVMFEIHYDNPDKSINRDVIIIVMPINCIEKIIKVVTVIIE